MAELHYFPFYAKDWLTGEGTSAMTPEAKGGFIDLLAHAWLADPPATLPDDDDILARKSGLGRRWKVCGPVIRAQFELVDGRLRNPKLYSVYLDSLEQHQKRVTAGAKGGKAKAERQRSASPASGNATAMLDESYQPGSSNQSHSQSQITTPPPSPAADALGALCVADLLAHVGSGTPDDPDLTQRTFLAECDTALVGTNGAAPVSVDVLRAAVTEFIADGCEPKLKLFRGYIRNAAKPRESRPNGKRDVGQEAFNTAMRVIG